MAKPRRYRPRRRQAGHEQFAPARAGRSRRGGREKREEAAARAKITEALERFKGADTTCPGAAAQHQRSDVGAVKTWYLKPFYDGQPGPHEVRTVHAAPHPGA